MAKATKSSTPSRQSLPPMAAGQRYGRLVAIEFVTRDKRGDPYWRFQCDCGSERVAHAGSVRSGRSKSCGCWNRDRAIAMGQANATHQMSKRPEHRCWSSMFTRCCNPRAESYPDYGGRGIKVCERWHKFENFYEDMGQRPSPQHSLDRKDNDGNYDPTNCHWATPEQQQRNRRTARMLTVNGDPMTLAEAAQMHGLSRTTLWHRLNRGWSVEQSVGEPLSDRATAAGTRIRKGRSRPPR